MNLPYTQRPARHPEYLAGAALQWAILMPDKLTEMRRIAKDRGGKCLSEACLNAKRHLEWRCGEGHVWWAAPDKIRTGEWCPVCAGCGRLSIELMQQLAAAFGGKCLDQEYQNVRSVLNWRYQEGHRWQASAASIITGSWCPYCSRTARLTLGEMQEIAIQRGGRWLSARYRNNATPLQWECGKGHRWRATPGKVKGSVRVRGTWYSVCARESFERHSQFQPLGLEDIQALPRERGGACLSTDYVNNHTPLLFRCAEGHEWRCEEGHTWRAKPANVLRGTWCPVCAGSVALTIQDLQHVARSKGGECLSKRYRNAFTPLKWRCEKGHFWKAPAASVKPWRYAAGTWCPECAISRRQAMTVRE